MTNVEWFLFWFGILAYAVVTPYVVYLCAKWGAYGWLLGRRLFERNNKRE